MTEKDFSYSTRIGKTKFIVNVKQSESAKKPLDKFSTLENLQKSS